jgi:hypothetical protein
VSSHQAKSADWQVVDADATLTRGAVRRRQSSLQDRATRCCSDGGRWRLEAEDSGQAYHPDKEAPLGLRTHPGGRRSGANDGRSLLLPLTQIMSTPNQMRAVITNGKGEYSLQQVKVPSPQPEEIMFVSG